MNFLSGLVIKMPKPGKMFDQECKGCLLDEATHWHKECPYLRRIEGDTITTCFCCEDHQDMCEEAAKESKPNKPPWEISRARY